MESVRRERKQVQRLAARTHGINAEFPRVWGPSSRLPGAEEAVLSLPLNASQFTPLQVQDGDGNWGFVFMPGYDDPEGGAIVM